MTVKAYRIGDDGKGATGIIATGEYSLFSWIIKSTQKAIKGGGLIVYDGQVTSTEPLPEQAVFELEGGWYSVQTPAVGMLGMYRHYISEAVRPSNI